MERHSHVALGSRIEARTGICCVNRLKRLPLHGRESLRKRSGLLPNSPYQKELADTRTEKAVVDWLHFRR